MTVTWAISVKSEGQRRNYGARGLDKCRQTCGEVKNIKSNIPSAEQLELKFVEGGAELLDTVRPLWKELNALHAEKSPHFADTFAKTTFLERKVELENKAITGQLLVILAITKVHECMAYCVCSVGKESSVPGAAKVGEIDSMFILAPYRRQGIGRKFVERCMEWFEKNEAEKVIAFVGVGNEEVLEFYKTFGLLPLAIRLEQKAFRKHDMHSGQIE
jgi:GNAT superfamily N-acetyltransferase